MAEQQLARLDALARRVEQLNPPAASFLILWRLGALDGLASDIDQQRRPGVRDAIAEAIRRFEISRDDVALASAEVMLAQFELGFLGRPEALDRAVAQVTRAERAVARAGRPVRSDMNLAAVRGTLALWQGSFEEAARGFRAARAIAEREGFSTVSIDGSIVIALARGGRVRDAVAEARDAMARQAKVHGDLHPSMAHAHGYLAMALELSGDHEAALVERRIASARIAAKRNSPPLRTAWGRIYELELELRLGKTPIDARAVLHAIAGRGATPRLHNRDALATVRRAGLFSTYVWGVAHGVAEPAALGDHAATLAFWRGDHEAAAQLASAATCGAAGCADWVRFSRWLAVTGDAKSIDRKLAALERDYDLAPLALAYSGVVLATLGRWSDARPKLEAARGEPNIWENQADLSELDTWLALARIETGDRAAARSALEESLRVLSISHNGTDGFTYTMPVAQRALADLVWEAGDHVRARDLMTRARDGFERLGPLLDPQRLRAERWLADHPH
ncbi:MAG: hypothetical protein ABI867_30815 [Kofleriaceae bacterium]